MVCHQTMNFSLGNISWLQPQRKEVDFAIQEVFFPTTDDFLGKSCWFRNRQTSTGKRNNSRKKQDLSHTKFLVAYIEKYMLSSAATNGAVREIRSRNYSKKLNRKSVWGHYGFHHRRTHATDHATTRILEKARSSTPKRREHNWQ